ncbi:MAG: hypothetical protein RLZZ450_6773 [Pseudomonadota bacterium]
MRSWLEPAAQTELVDVLERLGRDFRRAPSATHTSCPACNAARRHPSRGDSRGAVGSPHARPNTWRCHVCGAGGDTVDYVAYALAERRFRECSVDQKIAVREWFEGVCGVGLVDAYFRKAPPPPPPEHPPFEEVRRFLAECTSVHRDEKIAEYLTFRGIDSREVAKQDLAVAMPWADPPSWASIGPNSWPRTHHRLLVPLYDAMGALRSVLARSIERQPLLKSVAPSGFARSGLVMANRVALMMLRGKARPADIVIREGEIDFMTEAVSAAPELAVMGIISGSWTPAVASRLPVGARVIVATDADAAGDKYAEAIAATLQGRVSLERRRDAA